MNKRECAKLKKWTDTLTDEQLKEEYYDAVIRYARQPSRGDVRARLRYSRRTREREA